MSKKEDQVILLPNNNAYLKGAKAAITVSSKKIFEKPDSDPKRIAVLDQNKYRRVVPWGEDNDLPQKIMDKSYKSVVITSGMLFNLSLGYGQGIIPVKYQIDKDGFRIPVPYYDDKEINEFLEDNDINGYLLEQITDLNYFYNVFPEIRLNREITPKIVTLASKEAVFSRWEEMNDAGVIENHFYSAEWVDGISDINQIVATPVLNADNPLTDLRERVKANKGDYRFIIPISFPTPGRTYYQKPYWYSIIESGWYDFATKIVEFKNALLDNQMTIKYHIELSDDYFTKIFEAEKISDKAKQEQRIKKEYKDINDFLCSPKNAGKTVISYVKYSPDGKELRRLKINVIDDKYKGGEYNEDSEEVSNVMSYGMGVHPSIIGSSPGKAKSINGTEARELFLIKQALIKPLRDRILRPLYLIKAFNGWDPEVFFEIPDIKLTTLDKNPNGTQTTINDVTTK